MEHSDKHAGALKSVHADSRIRAKRRIRSVSGGEVRSGKLSLLFLSLSAKTAERLSPSCSATDFIFAVVPPQTHFSLTCPVEGVVRC